MTNGDFVAPSLRSHAKRCVLSYKNLCRVGRSKGAFDYADAYPVRSEGMGPFGKLLGFVFVWLALIAATVVLGVPFIPPVFAALYWFLVFKDSDARAAKAIAKLQGTLMDHEKLLHTAIQLRLNALTERRALLGITDSRIILLKRSMLGGFQMKDYQWKDLQNAQLEENIIPNWFGAKLTFLVSSGPFVIDGLPSENASHIYRAAQRQEQAWEEKHRVREMEERRAASGGFVMNTGAQPSSGGTVEELRKAKELLDQGVIDDAEFQEMKSKILARG